MADQLAPAIAAAAAPAGRQVSPAPHYDMEINGSGLDAQQLRDAIRADMTMADRRAQADLPRLLHDQGDAAGAGAGSVHAGYRRPAAHHSPVGLT